MCSLRTILFVFEGSDVLEHLLQLLLMRLLQFIEPLLYLVEIPDEISLLFLLILLLLSELI
jgi:hypothetical protein